jgi:hypothetical protein
VWTGRLVDSYVRQDCQSAAAVFGLVAPSGDKRKWRIEAGDGFDVGRQISHMLHDEMDDIARVLHLAPAAEHGPPAFRLHARAELRAGPGNLNKTISGISA